MAVALEAQRLVELRDRRLKPSEWVEWMDESVPGYPKCPVPRDENAPRVLSKADVDESSTTLSRSGSTMGTALDAAIAAAYGWSADIPDDETPGVLLVLNGGGSANG